MAAEEHEWTMTELLAEWRVLTGRTSSSEVTDAVAKAWINDYWVNHFPHDAKVDKFDTWFTQATSATDSGEYTLSAGVDRLDDPVTLNGDAIEFYRDRELFFNLYPEDEQYITSPTLAIGTDDATRVRNSAFTYVLSGYSYSKAAAETAFSGLSTVPQNLYGAFSLKIDEDGTVTIAEADDNSDGYATATLALEDLDSADSESAYMGYVTVISTDSGGFVPGTTSLSDSAVTATYTNGRFKIRNKPEAILLYGTRLYARPRPNDIFEIRAPSISERPDALDDDDAPADLKWGPMIAHGAALMYLERVGDTEKIANLQIGSRYYAGSVRLDKIKRLLGQQIQRRF